MERRRKGGERSEEGGGGEKREKTNTDLKPELGNTNYDPTVFDITGLACCSECRQLRESLPNDDADHATHTSAVD